ncbi:hypothetical protein DFJ73DRAFT_926363 [Zopfochytrium polystomum]|nr:hypothetical protein DFJ73DRAFT_926363 [Zopfochytrium polystomum]
MFIHHTNIRNKNGTSPSLLALVTSLLAVAATPTPVSAGGFWQNAAKATPTPTSSSSPTGPTSTISIPKDGKIVIVGGGPAGVHFASLLADKGFSDILVLEANSEVGGKSKTVVNSLGVPHELGTCYAHALYTPIFDLLARFNPTNVKVPQPFNNMVGYATVLGADMGASDADPYSHIDFTTWTLGQNENNSLLIKSADLVGGLGALGANFKKYIAVHKSIFGNYSYGLPPVPSNWSRVDMTAMEFLQANGLTGLIRPLRFLQQTLHAFYLLWWIHPDLVEHQLSDTLSFSPTVFALSEGFQTLWKSIADHYTKKHKVKVVTDATVTNITRGLATSSTAGAAVADAESINTSNKKKTVTYLRTGATKPTTVQFDTLVMAVDLSLSASLLADLQPTEQALFVGNYTAGVLATTLYTSANPAPVEAPGKLWPDRMTYAGRPAAIPGRVHAHKNERLARWPHPTYPWYHPLCAHCGPTDFGANATGPQTRVAYQYLDRPLAKGDPKTLIDLFRADVAADGQDGVQVVIQQAPNYFPRFSAAALRDRVPWRIVEMQGARSTLWIGSSVAFESVLDTTVYNINLAARIQAV